MLVKPIPRRATDLMGASHVFSSAPPPQHTNLAIYPLQVPSYPATPRLVLCTNKEGYGNILFSILILLSEIQALLNDALQAPHTHYLSPHFNKYSLHCNILPRSFHSRHFKKLSWHPYGWNRVALLGLCVQFSILVFTVVIAHLYDSLRQLRAKKLLCYTIM
jgi:hypothetical protein